MALLTPVQAQVTGTVATLAAADVAGETFRPDDKAVLLVTNGSGASITLTVVTPGNTRYGQADPDIPITVAAGTTRAIGPFPNELADPADGLVRVTYSAVTSVTRVLLRN